MQLNANYFLCMHARCVSKRGRAMLKSRNSLTKQLLFANFSFESLLLPLSLVHFLPLDRTNVYMRITASSEHVPIDRQNKYANDEIKLNNYPMKMWYAR